MRWKARPAASSTTCPEARQAARASAPARRPPPHPQAVRRRHPAAGAGEPDPQTSAEAVRGREPQRGRHARHHRRAFPRRRAAALQGRVRSGPADRAGRVHQDIEVPYHDPEVTDEDIAKRIDEIREQKAQYVNIDPRPLADGDYAVVALESLAGVEGEPVKQDEMVLEIGGADTFEAFTENLRGLTPGRREGIRGHLPGGLRRRRAWPARPSSSMPRVKGIRRKELPELERRVRPGPGRLSQPGRTARGRPQGHLRPAAARGAAGGQEQDRRQTGGRARFPGARSVRRAADQEPRGADACAPWRPRASTRAPSSWIGKR